MRKIIFKIVSFPNEIWNLLTLFRKKVTYDKTLKINGRIMFYGRGKIII